MKITEEIKQKIKADVLSRDSNFEQCGLIIYNFREKKLDIYPCKNISTEPEHHFELDPFAYVMADRTHDILGVYHSHKSNIEFSEKDKFISKEFELKSVLYCVDSDSFNEFEYENYTEPYSGREFELGKNDCFSLLQNYYKRELNIEIPDYHRQEGWYKDTPDLILKSYENEGFVKLSDGISPKIYKNDLILFDYYKKGLPSHISVYLGNNVILDHPRNQYSQYRFLTEPLKRRAFCTLRYKLKYGKPS